MAQLKITQVRSVINCLTKQKETMKALGLKKPRQIVVRQKNAATLGMIRVVQHLVTVEELA
jgi:large subunit ribosomal protein L30